MIAHEEINEVLLRDVRKRLDAEGYTYKVRGGGRRGKITLVIEYERGGHLRDTLAPSVKL